MSSCLNVSSTPIYRVNCNGTDVKTVVTNGTVNFLRPIKTYGARYTEYDLSDGANRTISVSTGSEAFRAELSNVKQYLKIHIELPTSIGLQSIYWEHSITSGWSTLLDVKNCNSSHSTIISQQTIGSPWSWSGNKAHTNEFIIQIGQWNGTSVQHNWAGYYRILINGCPIYLF